MPKKILLILLSLLLLVNIVESIHVDDEVEENLNSDEEVSVIVILKDEPVQEPSSIRALSGEQGKELRKQRLGAKKSMIRKKQDKVLSSLNVEGEQAERFSISAETEPDFKLRHRYSTFNGFSGKITKKGLEKLRNNPDVERIHFDKTLEITLSNSIPQINADDAWGLRLNGTNITGKGETICVIDTGIDTDHSAFTGRILDQYCYCSVSDYGSGGCCPNNQSEASSAEDDKGHGTHCAGIAAGNHSTYTGVAPDAGIIAIKVCDNGGNCAESDISKGIDWCTNNASEYNISVISISIGDHSEHNTYCNGGSMAPSINSAAAQNILVAIAAGNDGHTAGISAPACVENATPVGTVTDGDGSLLHNRGTILDLIAPGQTITAPYLGGGTNSLSGTSMAAPHVAGAAALLKQFMKLWNSTDLTPSEIEDVFNDTGKRIYDSSSSRYYSRLDIFAAIVSYDTAPSITSYYPSATTLSIAEPNNQTFNITYTDVNNDSITISWYKNGTIVSNSYNFIFYGNYSTAGFYNITVIISDGILTDSQTWNFTVNNTNTVPTADNVIITSTDSLNRTNGTLIAIWDFSDADGDSQIDNETKWYNNSVELTSLANLTTIGYGNTSKNQNWSFSVRVYDGYYWSNWTNSTELTIQNDIPTTPVINLSPDEPQTDDDLWCNITTQSIDIDNDTIQYYYEWYKNSTLSKTVLTADLYNILGSGNTSDDDVWNCTVIPYDGEVNGTAASANVTISSPLGPQGGPDFDGDGIPDSNDPDDDNDGINDTLDSLTGNVSNINSTITVKLRINGSENTTKIFNGILPVDIADQNDNSLVEFNWNFSDATLVVNWTIDYNAANGTIRVQHLDLTSAGIRKTVFINKSDSSYNYVCIADDEATPVSELDSECSGIIPIKVACSGSRSQYTCTDLGSAFRVSGLDHSAVRGIYVAPSDGGDDDGGGSGGGGGGGGGAAFVGSTTKKSVLLLDLEPDEIYEIDLDLANLALTHNYFSINKPLPQLKLTMELVDEDAVESPLENAYQYFRIKAEGMTNDDLKNAELEFKINKDWLNVKGYSENMVALHIYDNGWNRIPTFLFSSVSDDTYFKTNTDKFGYFAITSDSAVIMEEPVEGALEEITGAVTKEEKRITWKEKLPVIKLTPKEYLILLGFITFIATLVILSFTISRIRNPYPALSKYVKLSLNNGKKKSHIRKTLIDTGWPQNIVDDELRKHKKNA